MRTYFFKNVGTIDTGENIQNVIAITELPMNGMEPCFTSRTDSVELAITLFRLHYAGDGTSYKFVISRNLL